MSAAKSKNWCGEAFLLLALALPLVPGAAALAQEAGAATPATPAIPAHGQPQHRRGLTIDDRVKGLAKTLDLNAAQQSAVKEILVQRQQANLRIRRNPSISGSTRIEQFRVLQVRTVQRIRAVLNEEQKKKYDPLASDRVQREPGGRSVEDWLKLTTPH
jgi:Spy/CpxP family protein refolding chaperone